MFCHGIGIIFISQNVLAQIVSEQKDKHEKWKLAPAACVPLLPASGTWEAYFHAQLDIISEFASLKNCFFLMLEITG